ncbi:MAG: class I SAM-dependent methyltransferase [Eubacteriales bacterium]|nr:class I SAM-dependent methyltransferase [Eubacteriales bacterium]MDD3881633.1 class I SAM-dependent methyltransferase [Eubacteriales bacterium]MDD4512308.1 class I SAM-dependent methyltransferase [Eubacteriales bacterium]
MAKQYFDTPDCASDKRLAEIGCLGVSVKAYTDNGVFSKGELDEGSETLLNALPPIFGAALDLGCGWGAVGLILKKKYPEIELVMTDVNERALELSRENLALNKLCAEVISSDGYSALEDRLFQFIITNPPIRAGKQVVYRFFSEAREHLADKGKLYIVIRKQQGAESALRYLKELYETAEKIDNHKGFWVIECSGAKQSEM